LAAPLFTLWQKNSKKLLKTPSQVGIQIQSKRGSLCRTHNHRSVHKKFTKSALYFRQNFPSWLVERKFQILSFKSKKISQLVNRGLKNESSRCLPIEGILLLYLERGELLKSAGISQENSAKEK
jgi:hypothetical protein